MQIMKMKSLIAAVLYAVFASASLALTGCKEPAPTNDHAHQYTCSMHPEIVQNNPGTCPKCGMTLVQKN